MSFEIRKKREVAGKKLIRVSQKSNLAVAKVQKSILCHQLRYHNLK